MIELTLAVVFGRPGEVVGWATQERADAVPPLGMRAQFRVVDPADPGSDDDPDRLLYAQVLFSGERDDGGHLAFLYGGTEVPSQEFADFLEAAQWTVLDAAAAEEVLSVCASAPPMAAVHETLLVTGDPDLGEVQAWLRSALPSEPVLPVFGQRVLLDPADSTGEDTSDTLPRVLDLDRPGSLAEGMPALTLHAEIVEPGFAKVVFWVPDPGEVDAFALSAAGWDQVSVPDQFDPELFRLSRRIELAARTDIRTEVDDYGLERVRDITVAGAETVDPDDYELLPPAVAVHCQVQREMSDLEDVVREWSSGAG